ncbi:hypothetical protein CERSUDRAFT_93391 [Gelatoporia subvermispora B]|uniref:Fungal-type protein kinase domain-containing protein n=1 Tax=Ceriporiopsis subvermispora (strain B) TaxID=914234 RepID=M2RLK6_CERS8|nr:hypothetical protein CERSUDRAFT_93391 [Gelatoporia subvermispora B]
MPPKASPFPGISPRKMGSSSQNYISGDSPNNTAQSARELLKTELLGKLQFDVQAVLERVKVQDISSEFADDCVKAAKLNNHASDALRRLQHVVEKGGSEKDLYEPLQILFDFIADYGHHASSDDANEDNCFLFGDDKPLTLGLTDWTMPSDKPDCTILPRAIAPRSRPKSWVFPRQWWLRLGFGEVKLKKADGPGNDPAVVKPIVIQTADYARYHLAGRPFQLYSVGFLVFGSGFCVGIYDRAGVQFSPVFDILDDFTIFVKVVRSMTRNMTAAEYGMDPTARMLDPAEAERWQQQTSYQVGLECPAYEISLGGTYDVQRWITVGIPVWISVSLLGRGTLVWKVFNVLAPQQRKIMKNAWRRAGRSPESQIYNLIPNRHPGVSVLEIGSDVHVPGLDVAISTAWIRGELNLNEPEPIGPDHVVLHRLFIDTVGRPLWDYDSELELLKGIRAALAGGSSIAQIRAEN